MCVALRRQLPADECFHANAAGVSNCAADARRPTLDSIAAVHYVLLALGFGLQLCVIMGCLALTGRFAEFMDLRVQKQQLLNKARRHRNARRSQRRNAAMPALAVVAYHARPSQRQCRNTRACLQLQCPPASL